MDNSKYKHGEVTLTIPLELRVSVVNRVDDEDNVRWADDGADKDALPHPEDGVCFRAGLYYDGKPIAAKDEDGNPNVGHRDNNGRTYIFDDAIGMGFWSAGYALYGTAAEHKNGWFRRFTKRLLASAIAKQNKVFAKMILDDYTTHNDLYRDQVRLFKREIEKAEKGEE